ncbi:MAG: threonine synthase, partial [Bacillota bacterium]
CQTQVKKVFADKQFNQKLAANGFQFSSANSINWGRLVPQIVYYFHAYADLCHKNKIAIGDRINISVPTGNFGNILASYYAYRMGLPVNKFICASNDNKILTDFLRTGKYDTKREFKKTISPSMDILISSNLERFLFEITGHDSDRIKDWYNELQKTGSFDIGDKYLAQIQEIFVGQYAREEETKKMIKEVYDKYDYTIDPHTGVGVRSYQKYLSQTQDRTPVVIDSTASPYKFSRAVLEAITDSPVNEDEFKVLKRLQEKINMDLHPGLKNLEKMEIRHQRQCSSTGIKDEIGDILKL